MIAFLSLVILTITLIIVVSRRRPNYPPGPFPWPFIGNRYYLRKLAQKLGGQQFAFMELSKQYNSTIISLRLGFNDVIVVSDHKLIHEVLTREEYDGRPWNAFIKMRNMGMRKGITMNDGPECRKLRTWSVRTLKYAGFATHEMTEMIIHELTLVLEKLKDGGVHYLRPLIAPISLNVLWKIVTGKQPAEDSSKLQAFINVLDRRSQIFDIAGGALSAFPWLRYIAPETSGYNLLLKLNNDLKNIIMETIDEHKRRYVKGNEIDFIDMFLRGMSTQEDNAVFSDENLIVTLLDFFIAGTTTTTSSLDIAFSYMVNEQEVQRRLHEEIDTIIGPNRLPNLNDRVKMPFTESVLTECQRIRTTAPILGPRRVLHNTILGDYVIPKNTTVLINTICSNMNPNYFPDPTAFRPERHLDESGAYQASENLVIFGKGKRKCPGEALAKTTIFLLFVGLMQQYHLLPVPDKSIETEFIDGFVISPKPFEVLIVPR